MSSVLDPVGPLPPRVYWTRRVFVIGVPLFLLILIIAVSCSGGGGKPAANGPNPRTSNSPAAPQPCTTTDVVLTLATDHDGTSGNPTYTIGETPKFTGTFTNRSANACTLSYSTANEDWTVVSGTTTIWTTKGCTSSTAKTKTVTLAAGGTKTRSITWDGKEYTKCQPTTTLQPGQYVLRADLDGHQPAAGTVFQMTSSTSG